MEGLSEQTLMILEMISAKDEKNYNLFYEQLYLAITQQFKAQLIIEKPLELLEGINLLVNHFEAKEEFEKCASLHNAGYEIFNS